MSKIQKATARAYANIALVKYWGKGNGVNVPAAPSIGLCLDALMTETMVERLDGRSDHFFLNGRPADNTTRKKLKAYLDLWRKLGLIKGHFQVKSKNHFPKGTGLASSASGMAALATALSAFSEKNLSKTEISRLARMGSGSAARSIHGGMTALPTGKDPVARQLLKPEEIPWGMVIAIVNTEEKKTSSRNGMNLSKETSPFYQDWLRQGKKDFFEAKAAITKRDLTRLGQIMEQNTLAMHGVMLSTRPPLIYWQETTLTLWRLAARLRKKGLECYATTDAGPNVIFLTHRKDLKKLQKKIEKIPSVQKSFIGLPATGAKIISSL